MHPDPDRLFPGHLDLPIMRCLVVADLHYSLPQFDWLLGAAPQFDLVIFAGDALDIGSFVDFRAQIVVVKKYLSTAVRHHPRDPLLGQSRPRRTQRRGRKDFALDRRCPRTRHRLRRRQPDHRRHALYGLPVVGRTIGQAAPRGATGGGRRERGRRAGSGCITRRRRTRRPVGAASVISATSNWCNGSRATSHRW